MMSYTYITEENGNKILRLPPVFKLDPGRVELDWVDGCIVIKPVKPGLDGGGCDTQGRSQGDVRALRGIVKWDGPAVTLEEMDEAIACGGGGHL